MPAGGDEQTLASTLICTDDEHDSIGSSCMAASPPSTSMNDTTTTSRMIAATIETTAELSSQNSCENAVDSIVIEQSSQQQQNDNVNVNMSAHKAADNEVHKTNPCLQHQVHNEEKDDDGESDDDDDDDDDDDESVSLSFGRSYPPVEAVKQEQNDSVESDDSDDDTDNSNSYLHYSFHSRGRQHSHHESKHSLSLDRLEESSETNTNGSEQGRTSFSIHQLAGKHDELRDDSGGSTDAAEFADKINPLLHESVFQWSHSTVCYFPADANEWNLVKILGQGNFGQVWQVDRKDMEDDRSYALKMLSKYQIVCDGEVDCVIAEKRLLLLVNEHPFVTKLRAAWQDDNLIYFLQDFVQGGELFSRMLDKEKQALNESQNSVWAPRKAMIEPHVQFYIACIADALHYLHSKRICYRDLKPENALLDELGYPVLIDLGAAKLLPPECDRTFTMTGTPRYVAPELVSGSGHSFGVDHWALAVLAYEMLTGEHPFDDWDMENEMLLFEAIAEADYKPLSSEYSISDQAKDWIDQLFVKDPAQRLGASVANINVNDTRKKSDLLTHPWLMGLRMQQLRRRAVLAPWRPRIANHHDSSFFDDWDHLPPVVQTSYPALTAREAAKFEPFDDVAEYLC